jgi:hypothetical protein
MSSRPISAISTSIFDRQRQASKDLQGRLARCDELIQPLSSKEYQQPLGHFISKSNWKVLWADSDEVENAILALNYRLRFERCLQFVDC